MSRDFDHIAKEIIKTNKEINQLEDKYSKDMAEIKRMIKNLDKKTSLILEKIQEFEIIMDAAEMLEEHIEDEEEKYNTEWNPYEQEYEKEDYEISDDEEDEL